MDHMEQLKERCALLHQLKNAANSTDGKVIIDVLAVITGADRTCYRANPHDMAFACGMREVWVQLQEKIKDGGEKLAAIIKQKEEQNGLSDQR